MGRNYNFRAWRKTVKTFSSGDTADLGIIHSQTLAWVENYVIGLNLCPFARSALSSGSLIVNVCPSEQQESLKNMVLDACDTLKEQGAGTVVVAAPFVEGIDDFYDYMDLAGEINWEMNFAGHEGLIQLATFHPNYQFADSDPDDVSNWTNRSPFPLFHLLREDEVEAAVESYDGETDQIWQTNQETMRKIGKPALSDIIFPPDEDRKD